MVMKIKHLFLAKDMAYVTSQTESNRTIFLSYIEEKFTKIEFYVSLSHGKTAFVKWPIIFVNSSFPNCFHETYTLNSVGLCKYQY